MEFFDFEVVTLTLDGTLSGEYSDVARGGEIADNLRRGTDDAQHTAIGVNLWQIVLLDGAQGLGGGCVTAEDDQMASHLKEFHNSLARKFIDYIERTWSVGGSGIVAQIKIVVLG